MTDNVLEEIRKIRKLENPKLKPSPYLKDKYTNDYEEELPVKIRDYQSIGIMNLLIMPRSVNSDGCGLGKTLQILSTIGYVWLKEPEYIPIIIAKKSALHQWGIETNKFMQNMEPVIVDGNPYERNNIYKDFFLNYDRNNKRMLILTYDILLKDIDKSVVRNISNKPDKKLKNELKLLRKQLKLLTEKFKNERDRFNLYLDSCQLSIHDYVNDRLKVSDNQNNLVKPPEWSDNSEKMLLSVIKLRDDHENESKKVEMLANLIAPPEIVPGIIDYVSELKSTNDVKFMLVMDEVHTIKNYHGKMHEASARLASCSDRVYGLTATPIKNRLMEFFSIFRIIVPGLFPKVSHFHNDYCVVKLQKIGGNRSVPIVVGYKNLDKFIEKIEPYYLSRKKHEVAKELPQLITRELICELSDKQDELYELAEAGLLLKGEDPDVSHAEVLSSMIMAQQAANAPQLLSDEDGDVYEGVSSKLEVMVDLLQNELDGVKTIIFSRFEKMISLIEKRLNKEDINCVRITGKENKVSQRERSKLLFQDTESNVNVVLITTAGSESINLQSAEHMIFVDSPWSYGDLDQLIGRMIRIGSQHQMVVATHLIARRQNGDKTMDDYVIKTLKKKKSLFDKVAGESLKGGLEFTKSDSPMDIFNSMKNDKKLSHKIKLNVSKIKTMEEPKVSAVNINMLDI